MANRLASATSPYLLQHADNPVDWYPWSEEAFERARREDKPLLLSIGYAACHWCHVMAHESFEDPETAAQMNRDFVNIKVDREERPDVDAVYMDAVQALTGHGGWPMTVFLTPDGRPFYAGTYFPKEPRHGMPAFRQVLATLAAAWREERDRVADQAGRVTQAIEQISAGHAETVAREHPQTEDSLRDAHRSLRTLFDPEWGGFGGAPKFPPAMSLEFLLKCDARGLEGSLEIVRHTLDRMASGGIFDQVGGGFHRYAVDRMWHVPHFEKMLYDNAQLAPLYLHAWLVTRKDRYLEVARDTLDYLLREMRHPDGGFFSSEDADSEGREGAFYTWDWDALVSVAGEPAASFFGARPAGNWEGTNVLWCPVDAESAAARLGASLDALEREIEAARARLFAARESRVRPATDDKIVSAWNGLAIEAFAEAGRITGDARYTEAAIAAADFAMSELMRDGRLLRSWRNGRTSVGGFCDDYALLASGLLTLYEAIFEERYFVEARRLCDELLRLFGGDGGFYQTGTDADPLVVRPRDVEDNAVPSGNSAAALVLLRMALLTGDAGYERRAAEALGAVRMHMAQYPVGFGRALSALDMFLGPAREIAIVGPGSGFDALVASVWDRYVPNRVLAAASTPNSESAVPLLRGRTPVDGSAAAYVCERFVCRRPVTDPSDLAASL